MVLGWVITKMETSRSHFSMRDLKICDVIVYYHRKLFHYSDFQSNQVKKFQKHCFDHWSLIPNSPLGRRYSHKNKIDLTNFRCGLLSNLPQLLCGRNGSRFFDPFVKNYGHEILKQNNTEEVQKYQVEIFNFLCQTRTSFQLLR